MAARRSEPQPDQAPDLNIWNRCGNRRGAAGTASFAKPTFGGPIPALATGRVRGKGELIGAQFGDFSSACNKGSSSIRQPVAHLRAIILMRRGMQSPERGRKVV